MNWQELSTPLKGRDKMLILVIFWPNKPKSKPKPVKKREPPVAACHLATVVPPSCFRPSGLQQPILLKSSGSVWQQQSISKFLAVVFSKHQLIYFYRILWHFPICSFACIRQLIFHMQTLDIVDMDLVPNTNWILTDQERRNFRQWKMCETDDKAFLKHW